MHLKAAGSCALVAKLHGKLARGEWCAGRASKDRLPGSEQPLHGTCLLQLRTSLLRKATAGG